MLIKPNKFLGQNILINKKILNDLVGAAEINDEDIVLEIGAGTGNLTKEIAKKAQKVIAVEKDKNLIEALKKNLKEFKNVEIINEDILKLRIKNLKSRRLNAGTPIPTQGREADRSVGSEASGLETGNYKVVGNIPYYLTSRLFRIIFENWPRPKLIVFTIQKEVAQRIIAKPPNMNILALIIQYFSEPQIIKYIDKKNFQPIPKVDSAIIRLKPNNKESDKELFELIKAGFKSRRQTLINNLKRHPNKEKFELEEILKDLNIDSSSRAEALNLEQWRNLLNKLS